MTISGVARGNNISPLAAALPRPSQRVSPSASATPSGVATAVVSAASSMLLNRARRRLGSAATEPTGSPQYHRVEKPCQELRDRPALNENWMAITTGSSDQITYSQ